MHNSSHLHHPVRSVLFTILEARLYTHIASVRRPLLGYTYCYCKSLGSTARQRSRPFRVSSRSVLLLSTKISIEIVSSLSPAPGSSSGRYCCRLGRLCRPVQAGLCCCRRKRRPAFTLTLSLALALVLALTSSHHERRNHPSAALCASQNSSYP